jgi:mercuric ion binding protein
MVTGSAWAAPKTVTLSVPSMYCPVCPITVKKALTKVPGVSRVEVSLAKRQAVVTYDDAEASVAALTRATKDAGYPSSLATGGK